MQNTLEKALRHYSSHFFQKQIYVCLVEYKMNKFNSITLYSKTESFLSFRKTGVERCQ